MAILLCSKADILTTHVAAHWQSGLVALLADGESQLADPLRAVHDDLLVVDIHGPRFNRLNFDALELVIFDLHPETLLSPGGRRLVDALGHLATDELTIAFIGPATELTGAFLQDGITAGLNLIHGAVVIPVIQEVADLQGLLASMSAHGVRLLALDAPVCLRYEQGPDTVAVADAALDGDDRKGSALMVAFHATEDGKPPTARLHALTIGMTRGWP